MSNYMPSSFIISKRLAAKMSTSKARFVDATTGDDPCVDHNLTKAAAELLGMSNAAAADDDHHLLYVSGNRILHVAYAEAHDRVYGPPANCDDIVYESWWIRHRAWRHGVVAAVATSSNAEETARFFADGHAFQSAVNPYLAQLGEPAATPAASETALVAGLCPAGDSPSGRVRLLCPSCKSADVMRDAYARWSFDDQAWVLAEAFDHMVCEACETEARDLLVVQDDTGA